MDADVNYARSDDLICSLCQHYYYQCIHTTVPEIALVSDFECVRDVIHFCFHQHMDHLASAYCAQYYNVPNKWKNY